MIEMGLEEETQSLVDQGFLSNHAACSSVGYREVCSFLRNEITREELISSICLSTRRLVSKQRKWFRKRFPPSSRLLLDPDSELRPADLKWVSGALTNPVYVAKFVAESFITRRFTFTL